MQTAISLPDEIFRRASTRANGLGLSRSEFFARAATSYLDELDAHSVTRQIDTAREQTGKMDDSTGVAVQAGHQLMLETNDEW